MKRAISLFPIAVAMLVGLAASADTGLEFPSKGEMPIGTVVAFKWDNPSQDGLHWFGEGQEGITYTWEYRPEPQSGYYALFFYSDGSGTFNPSQMFYGVHPYPENGGANNQNHDWEISGGGATQDLINTGPYDNRGPPNAVEKDVWYQQALVISGSDAPRTATFYIDLPSTANVDFIQSEIPGTWGDETAPLSNEVLFFGDAPWWSTTPAHERASGTFRNLKIWSMPLTTQELRVQASSDTQLSKSENPGLWYHNADPTPDDISDKSGSPSHNPVWASSARPGLFQVPEPSVWAVRISALSTLSLVVFVRRRVASSDP